MPAGDLLEPMVFSCGHRSPSIGAILLDTNGERYQIPAGATVAFRMVRMSDESVKVNSAAAVIEQVDEDEATWGAVRYDWTADDVDTVAKYWGWFIVTLGDGRTERWPPAPQMRVEFATAP